LTKIGKQQVTAAQQIPPVIRKLAAQLARASQPEQGEHAAAVGWVKGTTQQLARLVNTAGYAVRYRWEESFLPGEVTDPEWIGRESHSAAGLIMNGANLLRDLGDLPGDRPARPTPLMRHAQAALAAVDNAGRLLEGAGLYAPNPEEAALLIGAVRTAAGELVQVLLAESRLAGRVHGPEVAAVFTPTGQYAAQGHDALSVIVGAAARDAKVWRSRAHRERLAAAWAARS
jgi:hypothetical protein